MKFLGAAAAIVSIGVAPAWAQSLSDAEAERAARELQASHIEANVPPEADFARLLQHDINAYFAENGVDFTVTRFELLRQGATQAGVSYPKFYLWVSLSSDGNEPIAGAVRVAAVERVRFQITDFLPASEILRDPEIVAAIFPAPLVGPIRERAAQAMRASTAGEGLGLGYPTSQPDGSPLTVAYCLRVGNEPGNPFDNAKACFMVACEEGDEASCEMAATYNGNLRRD